MDIIEAIEDERFFRPLFKDLSTWHNWTIFLKALFGLGIEEKKDRRLFKKCTGLRTPPNKAAKEAFVIAGRRSGKSFISSIIAVYLACFKDWSKFLNVGEEGWIFIVSPNKQQGKIVKDYVSGILNSIPSLKKLIEKELEWRIELSNDISIGIQTASFRTLRNYTILSCIIEELAFLRTEEEFSANPDREILNAILPSMATIPESILIGISTPYSRSGVLYEMYREFFGSREKDAPLVWKSPTKVMNPTISSKVINAAYKWDKSAARSEFGSEFRQDLENFLSLELIKAVTVEGRLELPKMEGVRYIAHIDSSGGRAASFALAISHRDERGKIILDLIREACSPFRPDEVVHDFAQVLKSYDISMVKSDAYAGEWVSSAFRNHEIMVENSELSASGIYLSFLPLISNQGVELLDNKRLSSQLRNLERKSRPGGKDQVSHPALSGYFDDVAVSVCGACVNAAQGKEDTEFQDLYEGVLSQDTPIELTPQERLDKRIQHWLLTDELLPPDDIEKNLDMED